MFIQTTNRAIEMSKGTMRPTFEYFCKGLICEKYILIYSHQLFKSKALMKHNKKNPNNFFNENPKAHIKGSIPHSYNDDDSSNMVSNKNKYIMIGSTVEKLTTLKRFALNLDMN